MVYILKFKILNYRCLVLIVSIIFGPISTIFTILVASQIEKHVSQAFSDGSLAIWNVKAAHFIPLLSYYTYSLVSF